MKEHINQNHSQVNFKNLHRSIVLRVKNDELILIRLANDFSEKYELYKLSE